MYGQLLAGRHALPAGNPTLAGFGGSSKLSAVATHLLIGNSHLESISPQADVSALGFYLSGGTSNPDPNLSIGGQISTTAFQFQTFDQKTSLPGVTIEQIGNSSIGVGVLSYEETDDGYIFKWIPPGSGSTAGRLVTGSGKYGILTANGVGTGYCVVTIAWDGLSAGLVETKVKVSNNIPNIFSSVDATQAESGYTSHRCVYVKNQHPDQTLTNLKLSSFREGNTGSVVEVAADTAGAGNGISTGIATTPASETADPALNFSSEATLPDLLPGQTSAFWMRRTIYQGWYKELNPDVHLLLLTGGF